MDHYFDFTGHKLQKHKGSLILLAARSFGMFDTENFKKFKSTKFPNVQSKTMGNGLEGKEFKLITTLD